MGRAGPSAEDRQLTALYREYAPALRRYTRRYLGSESDAEDVVQEVFIRLSRRGELNTLDSPSAVLFTTAFRLALNEIRRRKTAALDGAASLDDEPPVDAGRSPEAQFIAKSEFLTYYEAVQQLPPQCRRVVTLRQIYGYSFKEIQDRMGLSISTLEKHMGRGKQLCRQTVAALAGGDAANVAAEPTAVS
jgi:RNA polymerase sigma factor (sigma-70 family)